MDEAKVTGLLGLCVRARQATFGMDGCLKQVRSGQAALLTVDEEASAATLDKYRQACETHRVPLHILPAGLLGLCVRARQAVFGMDGCLKAVRNGSAALIVADEEASEATRDKYRQACSHHGVQLAVLPAGLLHAATGRPGVAMAIVSGGLAKQLSLILQAQEQQINPENHCGGASVE